MGIPRRSATTSMILMFASATHTLSNIYIKQFAFKLTLFLEKEEKEKSD
jgi:hypothetical protein